MSRNCRPIHGIKHLGNLRPRLRAAKLKLVFSGPRMRFFRGFFAAEGCGPTHRRCRRGAAVYCRLCTRTSRHTHPHTHPTRGTTSTTRQSGGVCRSFSPVFLAARSGRWVLQWHWAGGTAPQRAECGVMHAVRPGASSGLQMADTGVGAVPWAVPCRNHCQRCLRHIYSRTPLKTRAGNGRMAGNGAMLTQQRKRNETAAERPEKYTLTVEFSTQTTRNNCIRVI